jgi:hypothetical protein
MVAPDDDPDMFVLDVANGELQKPPARRAATRVGGRYDRFIRWSGEWICAENSMLNPATTHQWIPIPDRLATPATPPSGGCP